MIQYINQKFSSFSSLLESDYIEPMSGYAICSTKTCQPTSACTLADPMTIEYTTYTIATETAIWIAYIKVSLNFSGNMDSGKLKIGAK